MGLRRYFRLQFCDCAVVCRSDSAVFSALSAGSTVASWLVMEAPPLTAVIDEGYSFPAGGTLPEKAHTLSRLELLFQSRLD